MQWILASASPRRRLLLESIGFDCAVSPANIDEERFPGESARHYANRVALEKGKTVQVRYPKNRIISADTVVIVSGQILGKPNDAREAASMLRLLSSRWHTVSSVVAIVSPEGCGSRLSSTRVKFRTLAEAEIAHYVSSGEPLDKAGAYGMQGIGAVLIEEIRGSFSTVIGFPLGTFLGLVEELFGPPWTQFVHAPRPDPPLWA